MFYNQKETRNHYSKVLQTKSPLYYERFDRHMLEKRRHVRELVSRAFARLFPEKVDNLLDIGCGTGFYFPLLMEHAESITGIDICAPMLEKAQELIREKKLADQRAEVNKSKEISEKEKGKTRMIVAETQRQVVVIQEEKAAAINIMQAETERKITKIRADAEKYATEKRADSDLIAAQKIAAGELLVKTAEAEGERLRNQAMMGAGGSVIVALEAARNLQFEDITISTVDIDLLNIDEMVTKLGVPAKSGK